MLEEIILHRVVCQEKNSITRGPGGLEEKFLPKANHPYLP